MMPVSSKWMPERPGSRVLRDDEFRTNLAFSSRRRAPQDQLAETGYGRFNMGDLSTPARGDARADLKPLRDVYMHWWPGLGAQIVTAALIAG
jgi:hypothetical protein